MSVVGILLVLIGVPAMGWGVYAAFGESRKRQLAGAAVAPLGILTALVGAVLYFVPGFF